MPSSTAEGAAASAGGRLPRPANRAASRMRSCRAIAFASGTGELTATACRADEANLPSHAGLAARARSTATDFMLDLRLAPMSAHVSLIPEGQITSYSGVGAG